LQQKTVLANNLHEPIHLLISGQGPGKEALTGGQGTWSNDASEEESRGDTMPGIVPPVLRTPSGLRQEPNQTCSKREKLEQRARSNVVVDYKFELNQTKGDSKKERKKLGIVYHNLSIKIYFYFYFRCIDEFINTC
jgi:hypothetical protein